MTKDLKMTRGDTFKRQIKLEKQDHSEIDLSGITEIYFSVKANVHDKECLFQKALNNGIAITNNIIEITIDSKDTAGLDFDTYCYDLQITLNGSIYTILKGNFIIDWEVTNEVSS